MLNETDLQTRAAQMVDREVNCCLSSLVATLAMCNDRLDLGDMTGPDSYGREELMQQAYDLAAPIDDYEEAAIQGHWTFVRDTGRSDKWTRVGCEDGGAEWFNTAREVCEADDIEPYSCEVYEHWAVSQWLADKLAAKGEKVDNDFAGLCVWARTTSGQAISMDAVIRAIVTEMMEAV